MCVYIYIHTYAYMYVYIYIKLLSCIKRLPDDLCVIIDMRSFKELVLY